MQKVEFHAVHAANFSGQQPEIQQAAFLTVLKDQLWLTSQIIVLSLMLGQLALRVDNDHPMKPSPSPTRQAGQGPTPAHRSRQ
jgi:hypothetical protein